MKTHAIVVSLSSFYTTFFLEIIIIKYFHYCWENVSTGTPNHVP